MGEGLIARHLNHVTGAVPKWRAPRPQLGVSGQSLQDQDDRPKWRGATARGWGGRGARGKDGRIRDHRWTGETRAAYVRHRNGRVIDAAALPVAR